METILYEERNYRLRYFFVRYETAVGTVGSRSFQTQEGFLNEQNVLKAISTEVGIPVNQIVLSFIYEFKNKKDFDDFRFVTTTEGNFASQGQASRNEMIFDIIRYMSNQNISLNDQQLDYIVTLIEKNVKKRLL